MEKFKDISILICEDDPVARSFLLEILKRRFETIYSAENGKIGYSLYTEHQPDIILSDINMPEMNGIEMATEIRKTDKKIPILFLTAYSDTHYFLNSIELNINQYIIKPVNKDKLLESLERIINSIYMEKKIDEQNKRIETLYNELNFELDVAARIQKAILPQVPIKKKDFLINFTYLPLEKIGGDFFDLITINDELFLIFITDITGHGVPAALIAAMFKANIYYLIKNDYNPSSILNRLNNDISNLIPHDLFPSFFIALFNNREKSFTYVNSAHPSPLLINGNKNDHTVLMEKQPFLGIDASYKYYETKIQLNPGDFISLFTDGLYEFENNRSAIMDENDFYDKIIRTFKSDSMDKNTVEKNDNKIINFHDSIIKTMKKESKDNRFHDDVSLISLYIK